MNKLKIAIISLFTLAGILSLAPQIALAACTSTSPAADCIQQGVNDVGGSTAANAKPLPQRIKGVVDVFLFVTGAVAVLMIIIGGVRYVISNGDGSAVKDAKNTIMYAVIGLIIAIIAYAIVNFVIKSI